MKSKKARSEDLKQLRETYLLQQERRREALWSEVRDMAELHRELRQLAGRIEALKRIKIMEEQLQQPKMHAHFTASRMLYAHR